MAPFALQQIKLERLFFALVVTFLVADSVPHARLGSSLTSLGFQEVQHWAR